MNSATVINEILRMLRQGSDMQPILAYAAEALTRGLGATRCVFWIVDGDNLTAKEEFSITSMVHFREHVLSSQESTAVVLEFLSRFPDEDGTGVIRIQGASKSLSPTLDALMELSMPGGQLLCQLRSRGIFCGFIDMHFGKQDADAIWNDDDARSMEEIGLALSVVVQQMIDLARLANDVANLKMVNQVSAILAETRDARAAFAGAAAHVARQMGFEHYQVYLRSERGRGDLLEAQVDSTNNGQLSLKDTENPFAAVAVSGRHKIVNAEMSAKVKKDPFFDYEVAALFALKAEGETVGVLGMWRRLPKMGSYTLQSRDLAITIAQMLAVYAKAISA